MTSRLFVSTAIWLTALALLLFMPAGTARWPGAWAFLAISAASGIGIGLWLARADPALLEQRMAPPLQADQPAADKMIVGLLLLAVGAWLCRWAMPTTRRACAGGSRRACGDGASD